MARSQQGPGARVRRPKGFTILELLVVIFIMLAMTGIAVAAFQQFMNTERIKLAGGQLVSAISLARQYAMSRRAKVMVELITPTYGMLDYENTLSPSASGYMRAGTYANNDYTAGSLFVKGDTNADYFRVGVMTFDLSGVQGTGVVTATLTLTWTAVGGAPPFQGSVRELATDNWTTTAKTYTLISVLPGAEVGTWSAATTSVKGPQTIDVSTYVDTQLKTDRVVSFYFVCSNPTAGDRSVSGMTGSLYIQSQKDSGLTLDTISHIPRQVRILPYLRMHNPVTGGFSWLLDQDSSSLRTMDLPRNVHYALAPGRAPIEQYDPADLIDQRTSVQKVFFDLWPDGTCTGAPPDAEGWVAQVNTVILRDAVTGDVALLFMPPSSSFTRQRYLFGTEVDTFVAAHSLYSLW
jgi:prepilin-type N-terminal cleavage/methylation domain-containing protein